MHIAITPIGTIYSAFNDTDTMARQSNIDGEEGVIELNEEYAAGLEGLRGFSHTLFVEDRGTHASLFKY